MPWPIEIGQALIFPSVFQHGFIEIYGCHSVDHISFSSNTIYCLLSCPDFYIWQQPVDIEKRLPSVSRYSIMFFHYIFHKVTQITDTWLVHSGQFPLKWSCWISDRRREYSSQNSLCPTSKCSIQSCQIKIIWSLSNWLFTN